MKKAVLALFLLCTACCGHTTVHEDCCVDEGFYGPMPYGGAVYEDNHYYDNHYHEHHEHSHH